MAFALVPKIGDGSPLNPFRPKYRDPGALGPGLDLVSVSAMDYGLEPAFLIRVELSAAQHAALQAQPDALVVPSNLDSQVSALALPTIQQKLEAVNLPAHWVTQDMTYRQVLRGFRRVITFMQRWRGLFGVRLFGGSVTLDTRLNQLTAQQRTRLSAVADALGLNRTSVVNTMTVRQVLKLLADQLPDVNFGGDSV